MGSLLRSAFELLSNQQFDDTVNLNIPESFSRVGVCSMNLFEFTENPRITSIVQCNNRFSLVNAQSAGPQCRSFHSEFIKIDSVPDEKTMQDSLTAIDDFVAELVRAMPSPSSRDGYIYTLFDPTKVDEVLRKIGEVDLQNLEHLKLFNDCVAYHGRNNSVSLTSAREWDHVLNAKYCYGECTPNL